MLLKNKLVMGAFLTLVATGRAFADNKPPTVNAGPDQITIGFTATLAGSIADDGLPKPPGKTTALWTVGFSSANQDGEVIFEDATKLDTNVTFTKPGHYLLILTGDDGELKARDSVYIHVFGEGRTNHAPSVNAGPDQTIDGPTTTLAGSISDDGLPVPPGKTTALWTVDFSSAGSGANVTFEDPTKPDTKVTFGASGYYLLRLTANDGALKTSDTVAIFVKAPVGINKPPVVYAGPDQTIYTLGTTLAGRIADDGLPRPPGKTTAKWSVDSTSFTAAVIFEDPTKVDTKVRFTHPGSYLLRLTGNDGLLEASDTVLILIRPSPYINQPPVVNAGLDQHIEGLRTHLAGSISDDGLPNPPGKTTALWSVASATSVYTVIFEDPTKVDTAVLFSRPGTYVLRLTANDGQLGSFDDVVITATLGGNRLEAPGMVLPGSKNKFHPGAGEKGRVVISLPEDGVVKVVIRNLQGRVVKEFVDSNAHQGEWVFEWDGAGAPSGLYPTVISLNDKELKKFTFVVLR